MSEIENTNPIQPTTRLRFGIETLPHIHKGYGRAACPHCDCEDALASIQQTLNEVTERAGRVDGFEERLAQYGLEGASFTTLMRHMDNNHAAAIGALEHALDAATEKLKVAEEALGKALRVAEEFHGDGCEEACEYGQDVREARTALQQIEEGRDQANAALSSLETEIERKDAALREAQAIVIPRDADGHPRMWPCSKAWAERLWALLDDALTPHTNPKCPTCGGEQRDVRRSYSNPEHLIPTAGAKVTCSDPWHEPHTNPKDGK